MIRIRRAIAILVLLGAAAAPGPVRANDEAAPRAIAITAKRFEFEPKEIRIKKDEAVTLTLTSEDVTHGFFSRPLHVDEDIAPGKPVEVRLQPKEAGTYTVICDHYCGSGHGGMKMVIVVE